MLNEQLFFVVYSIGTHPFLAPLSIFLAQWFPYLLLTLAVVYEFFMRDEGDTFRSLARVYLPVVVAWFFAEGSKLFFSMPRPFVVFEIVPLVSVTDPFGSFPSTHAAVFAALGVTMFFCNKKIGKWFLLGAFIVALGRVAVGVHFPIDVFSGFMLGVILAILLEKFPFFFRKGNGSAC